MANNAEQSKPYQLPFLPDGSANPEYNPNNLYLSRRSLLIKVFPAAVAAALAGSAVDDRVINGFDRLASHFSGAETEDELITEDLNDDIPGDLGTIGAHRTFNVQTLLRKSSLNPTSELDLSIFDHETNEFKTFFRSKNGQVIEGEESIIKDDQNLEIIQVAYYPTGTEESSYIKYELIPDGNDSENPNKIVTEHIPQFTKRSEDSSRSFNVWTQGGIGDLYYESFIENVAPLLEQYSELHQFSDIYLEFNQSSDNNNMQYVSVNNQSRGLGLTIDQMRFKDYPEKIALLSASNGLYDSILQEGAVSPTDSFRALMEFQLECNELNLIFGENEDELISNKLREGPEGQKIETSTFVFIRMALNSTLEIGWDKNDKYMQFDDYRTIFCALLTDMIANQRSLKEFCESDSSMPLDANPHKLSTLIGKIYNVIAALPNNNESNPLSILPKGSGYSKYRDL